MGNKSSKTKKKDTKQNNFYTIQDNFETMKHFDDELPQRKIDNFQFVNYEEMNIKQGLVLF